MTITLLLRTLNAGATFAAVLEQIGRQTVKPAEILVVDSGSTDGTIELARAAGARIVPLEPARFTHAVSTNLGFREARGEIVAMLSQDAVPADERWLETLVSPFGEPAVAAAFGRQIARPECFPLERWALEAAYPAGAPPGVEYSNVNSAARHAAWLRHPFDESVRIAEDRLWARSVAAAGDRIVYAPRAAVVHSHEYSIREAYERCRAEARARLSAEGTGETLSLLYKAWPRQALKDLRRLAAERKLKDGPRAAVYRLAQFAGMVSGGRRK